jgi:hypothetical protein
MAFPPGVPGTPVARPGIPGLAWNRVIAVPLRGLFSTGGGLCAYSARRPSSLRRIRSDKRKREAAQLIRSSGAAPPPPWLRRPAPLRWRTGNCGGRS